jgi:A/G-specific adenine glycosylase
MMYTMDLTDDLLDWFADHARDLPWRRNASPWAILVSEIMLQQTPVARVLPTYLEWMQRWPTPADLATASSGDAVRMWGKLGYPRRALRLHECARVLLERHSGSVPDDVDALEALPGIGTYTARAVCAFAFGQRQPVVDTNVRRVVARIVLGEGQAGPPSTRRDLALTAELLPMDAPSAAIVSAALMELGATICTPRAPRCVHCPVRESCGWRKAGYPTYTGAVPRPQRFAGTDRQVRGLLMDVLRASTAPVEQSAMDLAWPEAVQRARALDGLVVDGLVDPLPDGRFALPGHRD